jgi:hypothetical protein
MKKNMGHGRKEKGMLRMQSCEVRLSILGVICTLCCLGWHSPKADIPPPAITLCDAVEAAGNWLAERIGIESHGKELFVRIALYEKPDKINRWIDALGYQNVSTNELNSTKWYIEFVRTKAQGISYMCCVDTNGYVTLEWSKR